MPRGTRGTSGCGRHVCRLESCAGSFTDVYTSQHVSYCTLNSQRCYVHFNVEQVAFLQVSFRSSRHLGKAGLGSRGPRPREVKAPVAAPGRPPEGSVDPALLGTSLGFVRSAKYSQTHSSSVPFSAGRGQSLHPHCLSSPPILHARKLRPGGGRVDWFYSGGSTAGGLLPATGRRCGGLLGRGMLRRSSESWGPGTAVREGASCRVSIAD